MRATVRYDARGVRARWHTWMRGSLRCGVTIVVAVGGIAACTGSGGEAGQAAADSAAVTASIPTDTNAAAGQGARPIDECPMVGSWKQCSLEKRLEQSGLVPVLLPADDHEPVTAVPALVYRLGRAELHVWIFADSGARATEQARLDPGTSQPLGSLRRWPRPAETIASNNLLAVLLAENERTTERIRLSLRAGLPPR